MRVSFANRATTGAGVRSFTLARILLLSLMSLAATGCTVSLVAPYDETTVTSVTDLLKRTDMFLIQQQSLLDSGQQSKTTYENNKAWYDQTEVDLNAIIIRAQAIPKNDTTVKQLKNLEAALQGVIDNNKAGFTSEYLALERRIVDQAIGAILAAEFSKKQP